MAVIDLFSDTSDLYAAARPQYPRALYEFLACCTDARQRAWDCGAGNGQASIALADYFSEVYATDVSKPQIANAIPKENVFYSVQMAESTNFPDTYFDIVTVAQALHWFNFDQFWPEVKRVLKPGGIFAAWGYSWLAVSPEVDAVIQQTLLEVIEPYWSPRIHYLRNGYRDIDLPFEAVQVPPMSMTTTWTAAELLRYLYTWSATRQCMKQHGSAFFTTAANQLLAAWGNPDAAKGVTMSFHLIAGRNSREKG